MKTHKKPPPYPAGEKKEGNLFDQPQYASAFNQPQQQSSGYGHFSEESDNFENSFETFFEAPPIVIVTQPAVDTNRVPELFEADAQNWLLYCGLGYFAGWCTACYLGMKYQVKPKRKTFITLVASVQLVLVDISHGSHHSWRSCLWCHDRLVIYRKSNLSHSE